MKMPKVFLKKLIALHVGSAALRLVLLLAATSLSLASALWAGAPHLLAFLFATVTLRYIAVFIFAADLMRAALRGGLQETFIFHDRSGIIEHVLRASPIVSGLCASLVCCVVSFC